MPLSRSASGAVESTPGYGRKKPLHRIPFLRSFIRKRGDPSPRASPWIQLQNEARKMESVARASSGAVSVDECSPTARKAASAGAAALFVAAGQSSWSSGVDGTVLRG